MLVRSCRRGALVGALALLALAVPAGAGTASARKVWRGDYDTCNLRQWTGVQAAAPDRVRIVRRARQGRCGARFELKPGDRDVAGSKGNERVEVVRGAVGVRPGVEQWWRWSTYFPPGWSMSATGWAITTQFHGAGGLPPNVSVGVARGRHFELAVRGGAPDAGHRRRYVGLGRFRAGRWYDFVLRIRWSSGGDGAVEVWVNGRRATRPVRGPNLYLGHETSVALKQGLYRSPHDRASAVVHDATRSAATRAGLRR